MPKRTNTFQTLVYQIQQHLKDDPGVTVTESKMLECRSTGKGREVDVVVETRYKGISFVIGFECTDRSAKADVTWIDAMKGKHQELSTNKLVLVSRSGFSEEALARAKADKFLEAVTWQEAADRDWSAFAWTQCLSKVGWFEPRVTSIRLIGPSEAKPIVGVSNDEMREKGRFVNKLEGNELSLHELVYLLLSNEHLRDWASAIWFAAEDKEGSPGFGYTINWNCQKGAHFIRIGNAEYELQKMEFDVECAATELPINLRYGQFMDVQVAYGEVSSLLPVPDPVLGDHAVFAVVRDEEGKLRASIAFTHAKSPSRKVVEGKVLSRNNIIQARKVTARRDD